MGKWQDRTTVLGLGGKPINWKKPPDPTTLVLWSKKDIYGRPVKGSFRTIAALCRLDSMAGVRLNSTLEVIQPPFNTTVKASAGTHDLDACVDYYFPGAGWWEGQRLGRLAGFGTWYRHPPKFSNHHHGFPLPPWSGTERRDDFADSGFKVGLYVPGQLEDYYNHRTGLAGHAHDPSWYPKDIRTTILNLHKYVNGRVERAALEARPARRK